MLRVRVSVMQRSTRDSIGSLFNSGRFSRIRSKMTIVLLME